MKFRGEGHNYERKTNREHTHMTGLRCGSVKEFLSDTYDTLKPQVERDCNFKSAVIQLEIGGCCQSCRR